MDKNGKVTSGPYWTQNWIEAMWRFTAERFVNFDTGAVDFEALGREEYEFRKALFFRNFKNSPRAKKVFDEADEEYKKKVENGKQGGRPRKETTADGDTREDSQAKHDGSAITRNETRATDALGPSANHYGDAATSDGAEVCPNRESGAVSPTTISNNIGNGQGTEAPRRQGRAGADSLRRTPLHSAPERSTARKFRNKEEFIQWAIDTGLDPLDAGECWDATLERGGKDADGNVVKNIKAFAVKWCKTRGMNRRTA